MAGEPEVCVSNDSSRLTSCRSGGTVRGVTLTARSSLPPGPRTPAVIQAIQDAFFSQRYYGQRARYGRTWSARLPGHPRYVITSDREIVRRLFTGDPLTKRSAAEPLEPIVGSRSLLLLEPAEHLARRKLELNSFRGERVMLYAERVGELAAAEVSAWRSGDVIEVYPRAQALTMMVILELVFGIRDAGLRKRLASTFDALIAPRINNLTMFLPPWVSRRSWWKLYARRAWSLLDRLDEMMYEQIEATRADPEVARRDDVLALLVQARDDNGDGLTDRELRDELVTLLGAGHETTASAIAWAADLLAHNPTVASRLREGERGYLTATTKEVLRIRTVAPISAQRRLLEPFDVDGYWIDPDTVVAVDADGLHHDPELYPHPDSFRPERFLANAPDKYAYLPFGGGAHRCLGAALAILELELVIAAIAAHCDLAPTGQPARPVRRGPTWSPDNRGRIRIQRVHERAPFPATTAA
jgi:cytochrome P450 family 135